MTTPDTLARTQAARVATVITEVTSPTILAPVLLVLISVRLQVTEHHEALWWGLLAAVFVGVLPLAFLKLGARRGRWDDHHVRTRELRLIPLAFAAGSVAVGIGLLLAGHAPHGVSGLVIAMLAGLLSVLVVSRWWKVSIHTAVASGAAVVLTVVFGLPGLVAGLVIAVGAGWSRVALRDHTTAQVLVGAAMGGSAALLYLPLR